jgi:hypothetical protein
MFPLSVLFAPVFIPVFIGMFLLALWTFLRDLAKKDPNDAMADHLRRAWASLVVALYALLSVAIGFAVLYSLSGD